MSSNVGNSTEYNAMVSSSEIPPGYLRSGEKVILEEKPNFLAFISIGLIVWLFIGLLIWLLSVIYLVSISYGWIPIFIIFLIFPLPPLLKVYVARRIWHFTWYALTDRRIISASTGTSIWSTSIIDYPIQVVPGFQIAGTVYRIKQITIYQNFLGRHFNFGNVTFYAEPMNFIWYGINNPAQVRTILEEKIIKTYENEYIDRSVKESFTKEVARNYAELHTDEARRIASSISQPIGNMPLPEPNQEQPSQNNLKKCPSCGMVITDPSAVFCPKCGHKLE